MKVYLIFTRKVLALIFCTVLLFLCFSLKYKSVAQTAKNGNTQAERIEFLRGIGCQVSAESETKKQITVPVSFSDVYKVYNGVQKKANYDLTLYKGEKCTVYTYKVLKCDFVGDTKYFNANLIIYNGRIIGGDISSSELSGEMYPLIKQYEKTTT